MEPWPGGVRPPKRKRSPGRPRKSKSPKPKTHTRFMIPDSRPASATAFINRVQEIEYDHPDGGAPLKTLPDRHDGKVVASTLLKASDVARIWYGSCVYSQPGKAAAALFDWLGWKWEKKTYEWRGNDPSDRNGGKPGAWHL